MSSNILAGGKTVGESIDAISQNIPTETVLSNDFTFFCSDVIHIASVGVTKISEKCPWIGQFVSLAMELREASKDAAFNQEAFANLSDELRHCIKVCLLANELRFGQSTNPDVPKADEEIDTLEKWITTAFLKMSQLDHLKKDHSWLQTFIGMSRTDFDERTIDATRTSLLNASQCVVTFYRGKLTADYGAKLVKMLDFPNHNFDIRLDPKFRERLFETGQKSWLFEEVDKWFEDPHEKRMMWIQADAGMGKSHFCASLGMKYDKAKLLGCVGFQHYESDLRNPMIMLKSLVFHQILPVLRSKKDIETSKRMGEYYVYCVANEIRKQCLFNESFTEVDLADVFTRLVYKTVQLLELDREHPMLLIIDALDEVGGSYVRHLHRLLGKIAEMSNYMNIKVLVTCRYDCHESLLPNTKVLPIDMHNSDNRRDFESFLKACWKETILLAQEAHYLFDYIIDYIIKDSQGRFLIVKLMEESLKRLPQSILTLIRDNSLILEDQERVRKYLDEWLPANLSLSSLDEAYSKYLGQVPDSAMEVLATLFAFKMPVSCDLLSEMFDWEQRSLKAMSKHFRCLFTLNEGCFEVSHKSVSDWWESIMNTLQSESGSVFTQPLDKHQKLLDLMHAQKKRINSAFDEIYKHCVINREHAIEREKPLTTGFFSSHAMSFWLSWEDIQRASRCLSLPWISWRLSTKPTVEGSSFSSSSSSLDANTLFSPLLADFQKGANRTKDPSLKSSCKVMIKLADELLRETDIVRDREIIDPLVGSCDMIGELCSYICSKLQMIKDLPYIDQLKGEASKYLQENGGWKVISSSYPQIRKEIPIHSFSLSSVEEVMEFQIDGELVIICISESGDLWKYVVQRSSTKEIRLEKTGEISMKTRYYFIRNLGHVGDEIALLIMHKSTIEVVIIDVKTWTKSKTLTVPENERYFSFVKSRSGTVALLSIDRKSNSIKARSYFNPDEVIAEMVINANTMINHYHKLLSPIPTINPVHTLILVARSEVESFYSFDVESWLEGKSGISLEPLDDHFKVFFQYLFSRDIISNINYQFIYKKSRDSFLAYENNPETLKMLVNVSDEKVQTSFLETPYNPFSEYSGRLVSDKYFYYYNHAEDNRNSVVLFVYHIESKQLRTYQLPFKFDDFPQLFPLFEDHFIYLCSKKGLVFVSERNNHSHHISLIIPIHLPPFNIMKVVNIWYEREDRMIRLVGLREADEGKKELVLLKFHNEVELRALSNSSSGIPSQSMVSLSFMGSCLQSASCELMFLLNDRYYTIIDGGDNSHLVELVEVNANKSCIRCCYCCNKIEDEICGIIHYNAETKEIILKRILGDLVRYSHYFINNDSTTNNRDKQPTIVKYETSKWIRSELSNEDVLLFQFNSSGILRFVCLTSKREIIYKNIHQLLVDPTATIKHVKDLRRYWKMSGIRVDFLSILKREQLAGGGLKVLVKLNHGILMEFMYTAKQIKAIGSPVITALPLIEVQTPSISINTQKPILDDETCFPDQLTETRETGTQMEKDDDCNSTEVEKEKANEESKTKIDKKHHNKAHLLGYQYLRKYLYAMMVIVVAIVISFLLSFFTRK